MKCALECATSNNEATACRPLRPTVRIAAALVLAVVGTLVGCQSAGPSELEPAGQGTRFSGAVLGGQQPVTGATIQLYAVGTSGDGSAATPLLSPAPVTDANGNFNITGAYTCPAGNPLVYIVATGGNPGLSATNPNLSLVAALGPCNTLSASTFIVINEVTTVGAVYSLAAFISSPSAIGSGSGDTAALASAFTLSSELVNTATGISPGANVPAGVTVPVAQINTIADILASCVNSAGGTAGDSTACGSLFALTTITTAPTNTVMALLNLANNPTLNTTALYNLVPATAPFQPLQSAAPSNFAVLPSYSTNFTISPGSLSFGSWGVGSTSTTQTITLQNSSNATISLSGAMIAGTGASQFGLITPQGCGATLGPFSFCTYQIDFAPTGVGTFNAFFLLTDSSANSLIEIPLSGSGVALDTGPVTLSQSSLAFTVAGARQDVVVENLGNQPLDISNIVFSNGSSSSSTYPYGPGIFTQTNTCGASVPPQSVCTIYVVSNGTYWLNGSMPVTFTATMVISDNTSAQSQSVALSSTNTAASSSTVLDFGLAPGSRELDFSSEHYPIPVTVSSLTVGGVNASDFSVTPTSCQQQNPCQFTVTYAPTASGTRGANLYLDGTQQYVALTGFNPGPGPYFVPTLTPGALSALFPSAPDPNGNSNATAQLGIFNYGTTTFSLAASLQGPSASAFILNTGNCLSVAPQTGCAATVSFAPATVGSYTATVLVKDANSTLSQSLPVSGTSYYWTAATFPSSLQFGSQQQGTTNAAQTFVIADPNQYPLGHVLTVALPSPSNFKLTQGSSCPASLTQTCTLAVAFSPIQSGTISETATITDQTSGDTTSLQLSGTSGSPTLSLSPASIAFPTRATGTTSLPTPVTLSNTGAFPLTVSSIGVVGAVNNNFTQTNNCSLVPVGNTCTINVTFAPIATGTQSASISIVSNAASSPDTIALSGIAQ